MRLAVIIFLCGAPAVADAAGFEIYEHGAAATGMVGAFTARPDDASAIFYNPAGLADRRGWQLYLGSTIVTGQPVASDIPGQPEGSETESIRVTTPLPTAYVAYGYRGKVAAGVGVFTQYGLSTEWPDEWAGRFLATRAALTTVTINPSVAFRPLPWLRLGGGFDITPARVELERSLDLGAMESQARLDADTVAFGGNAGALVDFGRVSAGVHYRSRYDLDFDDGVLQVDAPPELAGAIGDTRARTVLRMPDVVSVGVAGRPIQRLSLTAQLDWTNWSRFDELTLETPDRPATSMSIPQRWEDGYTLRFGAEMDFGPWRGRAGAGYDWTPVPADTMSPLVPDADRFLASAGASFDAPRSLTVDLALMTVIFRDRRSELPELSARYEGFAALFGLAIHYGR